MPSAPDDLRERGLNGPDHAHQVHVKHALEALPRHRPERRGPHGDPGVGHHHVEAAEPLHSCRHRPLQRSAVGDVGREAYRASAVELGRGGLGRVGVEVDDHD
jgi:hypothetical protein